MCVCVYEYIQCIARKIILFDIKGCEGYKENIQTFPDIAVTMSCVNKMGHLSKCSDYEKIST